LLSTLCPVPRYSAAFPHGPNRSEARRAGQGISRHLRERGGVTRVGRKRILWLLALLFVLCALTAQAQAQQLSLLVVVPEQVPLDAIEVERWMDLLKVERQRQRLSPEQLPLLRLSMGRAQHRASLEKIGLSPGVSRLRTFTCWRDSNGWPSQIVEEHEAGTPPDLILARFVKHAQSPMPASGMVLGLLLVSDEQSRQAVQPFLEELGRFWLQRYGRVTPAPYPLASYDLSQPTVVTAVQQAFPELMEGSHPLVALCVFEGSRPLEVLQLFRDLATPATLVREISGARAQAMASDLHRPARDRVVAIPEALPLGLSDEQQRLLLISRLNETAQQLWIATREDKSLRNQGPKRILLRVIEDSRRYLTGERSAQSALWESLRDYQVEPLRLERDSAVFEQAGRLLELSRSLLEPTP
jgi:hypothetical protein